jgi:predicted ATPase
MDYAPYLTNVTIREDSQLTRDRFPGSLPFTVDLSLEFDAPVTFFVGENGSGKSTLLEAMAVLAGLPISGGGLNDLGANHAHEEVSQLATSLRMAFLRQPRDRYFFRAETQAHFASLLEQRQQDPDFVIQRGVPANPFVSFGGQSLHKLSHGEAFLAVMQNRFRTGLLLMDEPESALSPQRQLTLLSLIHRLVQSGRTQMIAATHSPILLTYPGAHIISFDEGPLRRIRLEETTHYQITRGLLNNPAQYWQHLQSD